MTCSTRALAIPLGILLVGGVALCQADDVRAIEERLKSPRDNDKVNALYDAAKKVGTAEALALIPPYFGNVNAYIGDRAIAAFSEAKNAEAFLAVAKKALDDGDVKIRRGTLEALLRTYLTFSSDVVLTLLHDSDYECRFLALHVLTAKPPAAAPSELFKLVNPLEKDPRIRAVALRALAVCDPSATNPLTSSSLTLALKDKDATVRVGALLGLRAVRGTSAPAVAALGDPDRRVRLTALEWIAAARPASAVPGLIQNLPKETGRPKNETLRALKEITRRDFGFDGLAWKSWWDSAAATFKPPELDKPKKGDSRPADASFVDTKVDAPRYYDFVVRSDRVAFIVDVSGSMRAKYVSAGETAAAAGERTRLQVAADALHDVIVKLSKSTKISVIVFNNQPLRYRDAGKAGATGSIEGGVKSAADVKKFVMAIGASNATNISDSLELVMDDPDVDTVYLLTDGAPSAGKRNLGSRIVEWARRVTALTRVEINTISFGADDRDADFLRKLAEATGGSYSRR